MSIRRLQNAIDGLKTETGERNAIQRVLGESGHRSHSQVTQGKAPDGRLIRMYVWRDTPFGNICLLSGPDVEAEVFELFPVEPGDELGSLYFPAKRGNPALSNVPRKNPASLGIDRATENPYSEPAQPFTCTMPGGVVEGIGHYRPTSHSDARDVARHEEYAYGRAERSHKGFTRNPAAKGPQKKDLKPFSEYLKMGIEAEADAPVPPKLRMGQLIEMAVANKYDFSNAMAASVFRYYLKEQGLGKYFGVKVQGGYYNPIYIEQKTLGGVTKESHIGETFEQVTGLDLPWQGTGIDLRKATPDKTDTMSDYFDGTPWYVPPPYIPWVQALIASTAVANGLELTPAGQTLWEDTLKKGSGTSGAKPKKLEGSKSGPVWAEYYEGEREPIPSPDEMIWEWKVGLGTGPTICVDASSIDHNDESALEKSAARFTIRCDTYDVKHILKDLGYKWSPKFPKGPAAKLDIPPLSWWKLVFLSDFEKELRKLWNALLEGGIDSYTMKTHDAAIQDSLDAYMQEYQLEGSLSGSKKIVEDDDEPAVSDADLLYEGDDVTLKQLQSNAWDKAFEANNRLQTAFAQASMRLDAFIATDPDFPKWEEEEGTLFSPMTPDKRSDEIVSESAVYSVNEKGLPYNIEAGSQKGSNPGGVFWSDDHKYYAKMLGSLFTDTGEIHVARYFRALNEVMANQLYRLFGVFAPDQRLIFTRGGVNSGPAIWLVAPYEEGYKKIPSNMIDSKWLRWTFPFDAWMANWDVAGMGGDNLLIDTGDYHSPARFLRVDQGGALSYRAQGLPKNEAFTDKGIPELASMRDDSTNADTAKLFAQSQPKDWISASYAISDVLHEAGGMNMGAPNYGKNYPVWAMALYDAMLAIVNGASAGLLASLDTKIPGGFKEEGEGPWGDETVYPPVESFTQDTIDKLISRGQYLQGFLESSLQGMASEKPKKTPQVPAMAGMTPLGMKEASDEGLASFTSPALGKFTTSGAEFEWFDIWAITGPSSTVGEVTDLLNNAPIGTVLATFDQVYKSMPHPSKDTEDIEDVYDPNKRWYVKLTPKMWAPIFYHPVHNSQAYQTHPPSEWVTATKNWTHSEKMGDKPPPKKSSKTLAKAIKDGNIAAFFISNPLKGVSDINEYMETIWLDTKAGNVEAFLIENWPDSALANYFADQWAEEVQDGEAIDEAQADLSSVSVETPETPTMPSETLLAPMSVKEAIQSSPPINTFDLKDLTPGPEWPSMHCELQWATYTGNQFGYEPGTKVLLGRPKTGALGVDAWFFSLRLYNLIGARAAQAGIVDFGNDEFWVVIFGLDGYEPGTFETLDPFRPLLSAEFPADAWLANWPVFGPKANMYENVWVKTNDQGEPIDYKRVVTFGTFTMKWTGSGKPFPEDSIAEMTTMLDSSMAPSASLLFSDVKDDPFVALPMATRIANEPIKSYKSIFTAGVEVGSIAQSEWLDGVVGRAKTMGRKVVPTLLPKGFTDAFEGVSEDVKKKIKSKKTAEKQKTEAAGALITDGKRILLVKRSKWMRASPSQWTIPGGTIDKGETPRQAALREAREELGHVPAKMQPAGIEITATYPPKKGAKKPFTFHTIVFYMDSKTARQYKPFLEDKRTSYVDETDGWAWVDIDEIQMYDTPQGPRAIWIPKLHAGIADPLPFNLGGEAGSMIPLLQLWKDSNEDWNTFASEFKETALSSMSATKLLQEGVPFDFGSGTKKPPLKNPSGYVLSGVKTDKDGKAYVEYRPKMPDGSRPRMRVEIPETGLGLEQAALEYRLGRKFPHDKPPEASVLAAPMVGAIWKFGQGILSSMGAVLTALFGSDPTEQQLEGAAMLEAAGLPITEATPQIKEVVKIVEKIVEKEVPVEVVKEIVSGGPLAPIAADQLGLPLVEVLGKVKFTKAQEATIEDLQAALKELLGDSPSPSSGTAMQQKLKKRIQQAIKYTKESGYQHGLGNSESEVGKYLRILVEAKKVGLWKDIIDPGRRVVYRGMTLQDFTSKSFTPNARSKAQIEALLKQGVKWSGTDLNAAPLWLKAQTKGIDKMGFVGLDYLEQTRSNKYVPILQGELDPPDSSYQAYSEYQKRNNSPSQKQEDPPSWADKPWANVEGFHVDYRNYAHNNLTVSHWTTQHGMGFGSSTFAMRCRADLYEGFIMVPTKTLSKDSYSTEKEVICVDMGVDKPIPAQVVTFAIGNYNEKLTDKQINAWMGARPPYPKGYTIPGDKADIEDWAPYVRRQNAPLHVRYSQMRALWLLSRATGPVEYQPSTKIDGKRYEGRLVTIDPNTGKEYTAKLGENSLGFLVDIGLIGETDQFIFTVTEEGQKWAEDGQPLKSDPGRYYLPKGGSKPWYAKPKTIPAAIEKAGEYIEKHTQADQPFPPPIGQRTWQPPKPPPIPKKRPFPETDQPIMTWMVGIPAVGKSTWAVEQVRLNRNSIIVDADMWKEFHPDYDPEHPMRVHRWSRDHVKRMFKEIVSNPEPGEHVIIDGTGTFPPDVIRDMNIAREAGYYTELVWVTAPLWVALLRNERRERKVPEEIICRKAGEVKRAFEEIAPYADFTLVVSTEEIEDEEFVGPVVTTGENGVTNARDWIEEIVSKEFPMDYGESVSRLTNGTQVQSLMFDRSLFSKSDARRWATANEFFAPATDSAGQYHRLRQKHPAEFKPGSFRTIQMTDGVKAVIGVPL